VTAPENVHKWLYRQNALPTRVLGEVPGDFSISVSHNRHEVCYVSYLQNAFAECSFLRELLEVLGVRVVIEREVCLEDAQLMMFERRAKSLLSRRRTVAAVEFFAR